MRRVARIAGRARAVNELTQLIGDVHAHADHRAARAKRRNYRIAFFERQTTADRNRFLPSAGKRLRGDLAFMLPSKQRVFEQPRAQHAAVQPHLDRRRSLERFRRTHENLLSNHSTSSCSSD